MTMGGLATDASANILLLLAAGAIMIVTLWTSRRALSVSKTELSLSNQNEGEERYGSSVVSRGLVRAAMNVNAFYERIMPARLQRAVAARFEKLPEEEREGGSYDLIRATVNLTTASDPHFDRHVAQTSAVDHLRLLHGFDGLVAGGPCVGSRECRLPHHGRADRRVGVVRDGLRRLYDRLSGGIDADVRRQCGRSDRIGAVRLDARAQQPQEEQGGRRSRRSDPPRAVRRTPKGSSRSASPRSATRWGR